MPEPSSHQLGSCLASGCLPGNNLTSLDFLKSSHPILFLFSPKIAPHSFPQSVSETHSPASQGLAIVPSAFSPWLLFLLTIPLDDQ